MIIANNRRKQEDASEEQEGVWPC